ncbi:MAG TPA: SLC13 family permease [Acidobacteriota bacterium]|nr:SLC13 family permease [Acidobacteriota bacterium]
MRKTIGFVAGPALFAAVLLAPTPEGLQGEGKLVLAAAVWMAVWWLTEALPIPATALLPLAIFPLAGVNSAGEVSSAFMDPNIVLFMGGFFLAQAIQRWDLHRRIALFVLLQVGSRPARLVLGFMLATAFLSMWVSNTATVIMMLPIGAAVLSQLSERGLAQDSRLPTVLMLGIAYAASIGGTATLIGTPPNIVLASQYARLFPDRPPIGFLQWMSIGLPLAALFLPLTWLYLTRWFSSVAHEESTGNTGYLRRQYRDLGPLSPAERRVGMVFALAALGWIWRRDLELGFMTIPGWSHLLGIERTAHDSTVAIAASLLLFSIPADWKKKIFLLDWEWARKIPWGVLILFGGGIALAEEVQATGVASWVGNGLEFFSGLPNIALIVIVCLTLTFLTEITSNTATSTIFMPILAGLAVTLGVHPLLLMVPGALSASCAFMLPVATPPNAIVFGSGHITTQQMARAGLALNLLGALLITALVALLLG